jgi:hypothetical protein
MRLVKPALVALGVLLLAGLATCILVPTSLFVLHRPSLRVLAHWRQPAGVRYDAFDPYTLSVIEADRDWRGFPLFLGRRHFVYVGRDQGTPSYGHVVDFSFFAGAEPLETYLARGTVTWQPDGVTFVTPSGHRLFIPRDMFVGGR